MPFDLTDARTREIAEAYERDGFVFPLDVLSSQEVKALRDDYEAAEAELAGEAEKSTLLRQYPDRLLPSFDALIRNERLVAHAAAVLGPDLVVWSGALFIKEPKTDKIVSWHQDLTYWGLDDAKETTCWVALSPAVRESGCMRFVPGSHKEAIVPHKDTYADNNLLSRGQEIAVEVDEAEAVAVELQPGQASLHHGHLFHASGPNSSDDRRIGVAIRYMPTSMKQQSGVRPLVALVGGEDRFGNFRIADAPRGRLADADFALCREDAALKKKLLL